jgi:hypothetical protein
VLGAVVDFRDLAGDEPGGSPAAGGQADPGQPGNGQQDRNIPSISHVFSDLYVCSFLFSHRVNVNKNGRQPVSWEIFRPVENTRQRRFYFLNFRGQVFTLTFGTLFRNFLL